MGRKTWLWLVGAALLAGGGGCATCHYQACGPALDAGPDCQVPLYNRQQVYVFLINGVVPGTLDGLRDKLAGQGYTKVYYGQLPHAIWMGQEMRRLAREESAARFVVVGYGVGAPIAAKLAADAVTDRLPVEAVVLLDPTGGTAATGVQTLVVRSTSGSFNDPRAESVSIPGTGYYSLPTNAQTVGLMGDLLADVAARVPPPPLTVETDWVYEDAPPVPAYTPPAPRDDPNWNFLLGPSPAASSEVRQAGFRTPSPRR
jgi:hypothetical protein